MFKIPRVKNALFGLPLETGSKIIGFIHLVFFVVFFIVMVVKERETYDKSYEENESHSNHTINGTSHENETMEEEILHESHLDLSASYFNDFAIIVQTTFAAFLLLGVYQKNLDFILSWLLLQMANMVFSFFFLIIYFLAVFRIYSSGVIEYLICEEITVSLVVGYCMIVVNSYSEELMKKPESREEQMSPIVINSSEPPDESRPWR